MDCKYVHILPLQTAPKGQCHIVKPEGLEFE